MVGWIHVVWMLPEIPPLVIIASAGPTSPLMEECICFPNRRYTVLGSFPRRSHVEDTRRRLGDRAKGSVILSGEADDWDPANSLILLDSAALLPSLWPRLTEWSRQNVVVVAIGDRAMRVLPIGVALDDWKVDRPPTPFGGACVEEIAVDEIREPEDTASNGR